MSATNIGPEKRPSGTDRGPNSAKEGAVNRKRRIEPLFDRTNKTISVTPWESGSTSISYRVMTNLSSTGNAGWRWVFSSSNVSDDRISRGNYTALPNESCKAWTISSLRLCAERRVNDNSSAGLEGVGAEISKTDSGESSPRGLRAGRSEGWRQPEVAAKSSARQVYSSGFVL